MAMSPIGAGEEAGSYRPLAEINVTPLVDVMLVLLIIFMVAAPLMMVGVPVQLPKTTAAKVSQTRQPIIVSVNREGRVFLREEELARDALPARLAQLKQTDADATVYVRADRAIAYGEVMAVMGLVSQSGFAKMSLIAEGTAAPPPKR